MAPINRNRFPSSHLPEGWFPIRADMTYLERPHFAARSDS